MPPSGTGTAMESVVDVKRTPTPDQNPARDDGDHSEGGGNVDDSIRVCGKTVPRPKCTWSLLLKVMQFLVSTAMAVVVFLYTQESAEQLNDINMAQLSATYRTEAATVAQSGTLHSTNELVALMTELLNKNNDLANISGGIEAANNELNTVQTQSLAQLESLNEKQLLTQNVSNVLTAQMTQLQGRMNIILETIATLTTAQTNISSQIKDINAAQNTTLSVQATTLDTIATLTSAQTNISSQIKDINAIQATTLSLLNTQTRWDAYLLPYQVASVRVGKPNRTARHNCMLIGSSGQLVPKDSGWRYHDVVISVGQPPKGFYTPPADWMGSLVPSDFTLPSGQIRCRGNWIMPNSFLASTNGSSAVVESTQYQSLLITAFWRLSCLQL